MDAQAAGGGGNDLVSDTIYRDAAPGEESGDFMDPGGAFASAVMGTKGALPYKAEMEERFGTDFSDVEAYLGEDEAMAAMGANAAAQGDEVVFSGENPDKELVAHELTHVVQQGGDPSGAQMSSAVSRPGDAAEVEADETAAAVASGESAGPIEESAPGIHLEGGGWETIDYSKSPEGKRTVEGGGPGEAKPQAGVDAQKILNQIADLRKDQKEAQSGCKDLNGHVDRDSLILNNGLYAGLVTAIVDIGNFVAGENLNMIKDFAKFKQEHDWGSVATDWLVLATTTGVGMIPGVGPPLAAIMSGVYTLSSQIDTYKQIEEHNAKLMNDIATKEKQSAYVAQLGKMNTAQFAKQIFDINASKVFGLVHLGGMVKAIGTISVPNNLRALDDAETTVTGWQKASKDESVTKQGAEGINVALRRVDATYGSYLDVAGIVDDYTEKLNGLPQEVMELSTKALNDARAQYALYLADKGFLNKGLKLSGYVMSNDKDPRWFKFGFALDKLGSMGIGDLTLDMENFLVANSWDHFAKHKMPITLSLDAQAKRGWYGEPEGRKQSLGISQTADGGRSWQGDTSMLGYMVLSEAQMRKPASDPQHEADRAKQEQTVISYIQDTLVSNDKGFGTGQREWLWYIG